MLHIYFHILVQRTNCDGCINTTICTSTTTRQCLLQFSKLFNLNSQCELYFLNETRYVDNFTEGVHMKILPKSGYYILCFTPTCPDVHREIYYEIPMSKIEDCSNSGNFVLVNFVMYVAVNK